MKRILTLLTLLFACTAYAQEVSKTEDNIVFFYNAELKDGKNTVCSGFDLDFHVNTYSVLQSCGVIDSMFVRCNEKQLAEIDNKNWTYKCSFQLNANQLKNDCAYLNVQNIDGNCKLYINKRYVRQYNNSFMSYRDNVKKYLKKGKNTIELKFSLKDSLRTRQRSPQYFYGWDWYPKTLAPHINAIWLSFEQESLHIDYANIQTVSIETDSAGNKRAEMLLNVKFNKPLTDSHTLIVSNAAMDYPFAANITEPMEFEITAKDTDYCTLSFVVNNAGLWYPNGAGNQTLYNVNLSLDKQENILKQLRFGIRSVKLIRQADKWGESFYFCVNGRDIFAKGANYIMTYDDVQTDVVLAARANMNMLRIWGGSDYGSDEFYDYCDEYGIMVWQDYPFSTELYPADKEFVDNVRQDAVQNMIRISAHPSLALVCGNNEIWEGWNHWGWKNEVKDTVQAVKDYDYLFRHVLDSITKQYVPTVDYIHSSPLYHGWGSER
ncbi:MAG: hypothetical protein IJ250_04940, partial [Bacteroidales bacterium]|nr:hypothetical protein [Bacteroidales bacterium]